MSPTISREGGDLLVPLRHRLEHLPLLLAGPILRRTESDKVTVWDALKAPREVTLKIYATDANGSIIRNLLLEGTSSTIALGQYLHVVAVTAKPIEVGNEESERTGEFLNSNLKKGVRGQGSGVTEEDFHSFFVREPRMASNPSFLQPGHIYAYDLSFGTDEHNLAQALTSPQVPHVNISYFAHQLPTFAMPPEDLNDLRLAHGSCRKLHGGGQDALPILDDSIEHDATQPNSRLHQLFFTGDQIYGDDVADSLLWVATEVGDTLLGWEENLPLSQTLAHEYEYKKPSDLKPGQRADIAQHHCGFTAMLPDCPEKARSHLFSLGEYAAAYLLVWSPILWPQRLPEGKEVYNDPNQAKHWDAEARHVKDCMNQLWKVRRVLANVPTYMIFDDHDVTDDWYLNRAWCIDVLSKPLGRRVVQNAMLAYAVFQAWGNTPEQFVEEQPGGNLLKAAIRWSATAGRDEFSSEEIAKYLSIPQLEPDTGLPKLRLDEDVLILDRDYADGTQPVEWHYTLRSYKHEVIVLDTRTWRGYPLAKEERESLVDRISSDETAKSLLSLSHQDGGASASDGVVHATIAPPRLLCPTAFKQQIQHPLELSDRLKQTGQSNIEVTFVILPTNLVSLRIIDEVQRLELEKGAVYGSDVGDAWNLNEVALSRLLAELFQRRRVVIVLSGDIHYGATIRLSYWFHPHHKGTEDSSMSDIQPKIENAAFPRTNLPQTPNSQPQTPLIPSNARVLAQLTASAFKNGELKTAVVHTKAKSLAPELPQNWAGWNEPPQLVEIQILPDKVRMLDVEVPTTGPVVRQIKGMHGNWNLAWEVALKNRASLPDWQYRVEWIKRQKAKLAPWMEKQVSSAPSQNTNSTGLLAGLGNLVSLLWRNRWVQEGEEVVGYNNFGVVSLKWSENDEEANAVIQDAYWQPPWEPSSVVYSRYIVPLCVDNPPPPLRIVSYPVAFKRSR
jgi:hypothetical protein